MRFTKPKNPLGWAMTNPLIAKLSRLLSQEECDSLSRATRHAMAVPPKQSMLRDGEDVPSIRVLLEGVACRVRPMPGGRRAITGFVLPGDFLDLNAVLTGKRLGGIISQSPCLVAEIPRPVFNELCARTSFLRALLWLAASEEALLREWLANMGQERAERRVAHLLCELRLRLEAAGISRGGELNMPVTQEELGESLGISTVHVNRVLQKLRADGLIRFRGRALIIPDAAKLEAFAEFDGSYLTLPTADAAGRVFRMPATPGTARVVDVVKPEIAKAEMAPVYSAPRTAEIQR
jgi:CRP-like cAMP-binding protein